MTDRWDQDAPVIRATTVRMHTAVRKTHVCAICKKTIEIGQRYTRSFAVVDERPEIVHQHVQSGISSCVHFNQENT